jgi:hypothetical protein
MRSIFFAILLTLFTPLLAHAGTVDLSISAKSIRFSEKTLYAGETVRIYGTIKNLGDTDAVSQVFFYQGPTLIGKSQAISVLSDGAGDDVFVDFVLPRGAFNIRAVIQGTEPGDVNSSNDVAVTALYEAIEDEDRDGILDEKDNCKEDVNADQADLDHDNVGDVCDDDKDGDGVPNGSDDFPTDSTKSKKELPKKEPTPVVKPVVAPVVVPPSPKTEVAGVTDAAPASAPVVVALTPTEAPLPATTAEAIPLLLAANVETSPDARFTYKMLDWRTYEFTALTDLQNAGVTYGWDFGDGATSVQGNINHAFPRSGKYTVTLSMTDKDGKVTSDAEVMDISFFHLDNPLVQLTLGFLLLLLLGLILFLVKSRKRKV